MLCECYDGGGSSVPEHEFPTRGVHHVAGVVDSSDGSSGGKNTAVVNISGVVIHSQPYLNIITISVYQQCTNTTQYIHLQYTVLAVAYCLSSAILGKT